MFPIVEKPGAHNSDCNIYEHAESHDIGKNTQGRASSYLHNNLCGEIEQFPSRGAEHPVKNPGQMANLACFVVLKVITSCNTFGLHLFFSYERDISHPDRGRRFTFSKGVFEVEAECPART